MYDYQWFLKRLCNHFLSVCTLQIKCLFRYVRTTTKERKFAAYLHCCLPLLKRTVFFLADTRERYPVDRARAHAPSIQLIAALHNAPRAQVKKDRERIFSVSVLQKSTVLLFVCSKTVRRSTKCQTNRADAYVVGGMPASKYSSCGRTRRRIRRTWRAEAKKSPRAM